MQYSQFAAVNRLQTASCLFAFRIHELLSSLLTSTSDDKQLFELEVEPHVPEVKLFVVAFALSI